MLQGEPMIEAAQGTQPTLGDLLGWLGRRWWILLLALITGTGGGWLLAWQEPEVYTSTTLVQVRAVGGPEATEDQLNLDTEAQVVTSIDTAARARELLDSTVSEAELADRVTVLVPPNTTLLQISYQASSRARAQEGAQAFATAYLEQREEAAHQEIEDRIARLADQIAALRGQDADEQVITPLLNQQLLLESEPVRGGEVRSPADLPERPSSPNRLLYLAGGLVAGLLGGVAVALLVHRLDRRVFRATDLPEEFASQVLLELSATRRAAEVVGPTSQAGREFSRLRNVMRASAEAAAGGAGPVKGVLLVCGVTAGSATGFVTANLAAAFARAGERVVVIGADPASTVFESLGLSAGAGPGLSHVINGEISAGDATVPSPVVDRVTVLRPGVLDRAAELPVADLVGVVLRLASGADRVLVEAPPMSRSIDAQALGVAASALLLVVECQRATGSEVAQAVRDFTQVLAPFAGMLLVPPARRGSRGGPSGGGRILPSFVPPPAGRIPVGPLAAAAAQASQHTAAAPPDAGRPEVRRREAPRPGAVRPEARGPVGSPPAGPRDREDTVVLGRVAPDSRGSAEVTPPPRPPAGGQPGSS